MTNENEIWLLAKKNLQTNLNFSPVSMDLWFGSMELKVLNENTAYFQIENDFKQKMIKTRYLDDVKSAMAEILGFEVEIVVISVEKVTFETGLAEYIEKQQESEKDDYVPAKEPSVLSNFQRTDNSYLSKEIRNGDEDQKGKVLISPSSPDCLQSFRVPEISSPTSSNTSLNP